MTPSPTGLNNNFLSFIEKKLIGCNSRERNCKLCFDEIDIKNKYEYDSRLKQSLETAKEQ